MRGKSTVLISEYISLIQQFISGSLLPEDFARMYDKKFLCEDEQMTKELFDILEDF